ncbi:CRIB domain-containing protein RIC6 [Hibiscus syriacus]|uniref:CRIB domain-containing protein RIC6 n=1 Tax=Hibiscus syriacus TaxID=106335 RepID=A0A6A2YQV1_HIBSY|nr:CRIB domain-containing protein RIC6 [Hibiscus syriacus]
MSSSNNKMKGLLKGLRYISEIFENEKEPEMQIGLPTDVKHVAHIGWDGPSAVKYAPSWMNEFKSTPANTREEDPRKSVSQDVISRDGSRDQSLPATETADVPKSSKRGSSSTRNGPTGESKGKEKSDKPKNPKKSSKTNSSKETSDSTTKPKKKPKEHKEPKEPKDSVDSDNQKKSSRRNKSKESVEGSSRRSKTRDMEAGSESGSVTGIREDRLSTGSGFEGEF